MSRQSAHEQLKWSEFTRLSTSRDESLLHTSVPGRASSELLEEIVVLEEWSMHQRIYQDCRSDEKATLITLSETLEAKTAEDVLVPAPSSLEVSTNAWLVEEHDDMEGSPEEMDAAAFRGDTVDSPWLSEDWTSALTALQSIADESVLGIHTAMMLGLRLRCDHFEGLLIDKLDENERLVRKAINSLTSQASATSTASMLCLLRCSAVHPVAVTDAIVQSASATPQHHEFFVRLLLYNPVLLRWPMKRGADSIDPPSTLMLSRLCDELHKQVHQDVSDAAIVTDSPIVGFIFLLSTNGSGYNVVAPADILRLVFLHLITRAVCSGARRQLFIVMRTWLARVHEVNAEVPSSLMEDTLVAAIESVILVASIVADGDQSNVELRDQALLLTNEILSSRFLSKLQLTNVVDRVRLAESPALDSLFDCCLAEQSGRLPPVERLDPTRGFEHPSRDEDTTLDVQRSLWFLAWSRGRGVKTRTAEQHQGRIESIAQRRDHHTGIPGQAHIQLEVTKMIASSGSALYSIIFDLVNSLLMSSTKLVAPGRSAAALTISYAVRCWCLAAFGSVAELEAAGPRILKYTVGLIAKCVDASSADPLTLRWCLKALGTLFAWSHQSAPVYTDLSNRIELVSVRVLFALRKLSAVQDEPVDLFQASIAELLCTSQLVKCEAVQRALSSNHH